MYFLTDEQKDYAACLVQRLINAPRVLRGAMELLEKILAICMFVSNMLMYRTYS